MRKSGKVMISVVLLSAIAQSKLDAQTRVDEETLLDKKYGHASDSSFYRANGCFYNKSDTSAYLTNDSVYHYTTYAAIHTPLFHRFAHNREIFPYRLPHHERAGFGSTAHHTGRSGG